jgi:type III secretion protein T
LTSLDPLWKILGPVLAAVPRITAAVTVSPLFPASLFSNLVRGALIVCLALFLYPRMTSELSSPLAPFAWMLLLAKEMLVGVLIGLALGALAWAFESAGALIDFQVGFGNAQLFDPFGGHESGPVAGLMLRLGVTLLVAGGGLYVFAQLVIDSYAIWPVSTFYPNVSAVLADFVGQSFGSLAQLIARLAMPVILLLALIDLVFGLINRAVPQFNVFYFTMPIKGALAALMLGLYLGYLADIAGANLAALQSWLHRVAPVLAQH